MSSIDYSILEIFCPARQETLHITSLYLKSLEGGYTEILPMHKPVNLTLASQLLLIKKEGNQTIFGLNITEGIVNIIQPQPNRTLINISVYDFDWVVLDDVDYNNLETRYAEILADHNGLNQFQEVVAGYEDAISKSDQIIASDLVPRYNSKAQELRDIEQNIKIEFEQGLRR